MGLCAVCNLVAHAWREYEFAAIFEFGVEFAFDAQQYVALYAPMISEIARRVLDHADAKVAKGPCLPISETVVASMVGSLDG